MLWVSDDLTEVGRLQTNESASFGAVLEDFEVRDAVNKIIANKGDYHDMDMDTWNTPPAPEAFQG
jgi:hypothetical protein